MHSFLLSHNSFFKQERKKWVITRSGADRFLCRRCMDSRALALRSRSSPCIGFLGVGSTRTVSLGSVLSDLIVNRL